MSYNYSPGTFNKFVQDNAEQMFEIEDILSAMLPDNPEQLTYQLRRAESFYSNVTRMLSDANGFLDVGEGAALPPKGSGTELDRKTAQVAAIAHVRAFRDRLDGVARAINLRLMLGMSLLKQHESERRGLGSGVGS